MILYYHFPLNVIFLRAAVQECSSSKQKQMWKTVQTKANIWQPVQFILNMKVWWPSMYLILDLAEQKKGVHNTFYTKDWYLLFFSAVH
jgi:hypothetical protein